MGLAAVPGAGAATALRPPPHARGRDTAIAEFTLRNDFPQLASLVAMGSSCNCLAVRARSASVASCEMGMVGVRFTRMGESVG